jgi:hypothetical protein
MDLVDTPAESKGSPMTAGRSIRNPWSELNSLDETLLGDADSLCLQLKTNDAQVWRRCYTGN